MKVLLTRPKGKNLTLASKLNDLGIESLCQPLLSISAVTPSADKLAVVESSQKVIFISVNAVNCAPEELFQALSHSTQVFAIGSATKEQLKCKGIEAKCPPKLEQHSEGLLSLSQFQDLSGQTVVIVRGQGGRELLAEQIQQRGGEVHYIEAYQRLLPELDAASCITEWKLQNVDTVIITSGEILTNLLTLMEKTDSDWLKQCQLIVVSERIEAMAKSNGFAKVMNAGGASELALLETCTLLHQGSS
ncbi:uroporphyrinogen-III synthase [Parashewanella tropica]|uniref:uroporphyrinogen-III synthase n=1 Tax=Parashewanella tropica TaxID=2547970 RepID=UPI001059C17C|nr:uroporphyrinogen-III synthase [Parashewanella tropica]